LGIPQLVVFVLALEHLKWLLEARREGRVEDRMLRERGLEVVSLGRRREVWEFLEPAELMNPPPVEAA
jgi:hypothetical protein